MPVRPGTLLRKAMIIADFFQVLGMIGVAGAGLQWPSYWEYVKSTYDWPPLIARTFCRNLCAGVSCTSMTCLSLLHLELPPAA